MDRSIESDVLGRAPTSLPTHDGRFSDRGAPVSRDALLAVARHVRAGTYQPRPDDVAEIVLAWLIPHSRPS